jgi:APA family basic amino acid/polyamine antiporter
VFSLENISVIAFRESNAEFYDPEFVSPGYPFVQIAGVIGGLVLIVQLGTVSLVGAAGIVVAGAAWYLLYGRQRTERTGTLVVYLRDRFGASTPRDGSPVHPNQRED